MDSLFSQLESSQQKTTNADRSGELVAALLGESGGHTVVVRDQTMDSVSEEHEDDADSESGVNIHELSDSSSQIAHLYDEPEEPTQAEVDAKKLQIQQVCGMVVMVGVVTGFVCWESIAWTVLAGVCAVSSFILPTGKLQIIFQQ